MDYTVWKNQEFVEKVAGVLLVALIGAFCFAVLRPFVSSMLWSAILVFASWPVYQFVKERVTGHHAAAAAAIMTVVAALLVVVPIWILAASSLDMASWVVARLQELRTEGIPKVAQTLQAHPWFDEYADEIRQGLTALFSDTEQMTKWGAGASKMALTWLVKRGVSMGFALFQVGFSLLFMFFFYLRGEWLAAQITKVMNRIGGTFMGRLQERVARTLNVVVRGAVGTAFAQALAAAIGFMLFDVPNVWLLAALVFVLGLIPMGPPLVWVPAGLWILSTGRAGAGIGMLLYGGVVISGIDNVVRPILIAGGMDLEGMTRRLKKRLTGRRRALVTGMLTGLLTGAGFACAGLPWWLGGMVALVMGFSSFSTAGVVGFLGGAIWKFAVGQMMNGIWLLIFAGGLSLLMPVILRMVHGVIREKNPAAEGSGKVVEGGEGPIVAEKEKAEALPFALMIIGVTGGMLAFGFIGMFLGPVVLALGNDVVMELTKPRANEAAGEGNQSEGSNP